jgi:NhaP-type Na+/H+ or K+/H+ antiporter
MEKTIRIYIPKWALILYSLLALVLIPWIFNLAVNLPTRHIVHHWDAVWVGFDILMFLVVALTVYFAVKKMVWVTISASALATLFVVDAWFDIMTSRPGRELRNAIFFGSLEIILAGLTFRFVHHMIKHSAKPHDNVKLVATPKT